MNTIEALLVEYFDLKTADKTIRAERNEYLKRHECGNKDSFDAGIPYDCINRMMDGNMSPLCDICTQRNLWYSRLQTNSHRRGQIMRRLKRLVTARVTS